MVQEWEERPSGMALWVTNSLPMSLYLVRLFVCCVPKTTLATGFILAGLDFMLVCTFVHYLCFVTQHRAVGRCSEMVRP